MTTKSVCPVCLNVVEAHYRVHDDGVYLEKECSEHGSFSTIVWRGTFESYASWLQDAGPRPPETPSGPHRMMDLGCPCDCGLCPQHLSETCTGALMVTERCNLSCRFCFSRGAESMLGDDPDLAELERRLRFYKETSGAVFPLELCGGEPTVRDDLPEIVRMACELGFCHIQINSNGIRLAEDDDLAWRLREAGTSVIYLGYDGLCDEPYAHLGAVELLEIKERAIAHCARAKLPIVLVPVLVHGVNDFLLGKVMEDALRWMPAVKGVHVQPASFFGAYHDSPDTVDRITLPEVMNAFEEQTGGMIKTTDFMPPGCGHPLCSFQAVYVKDVHGNLKALSKRTERISNTGVPAHVRRIISQQWSNGTFATLTVGGMLFMDSWNFDIDRIRRCGLHIVGADDSLYPLCAKYLTSCDGARLHPGIS